MSKATGGPITVLALNPGSTSTKVSVYKDGVQTKVYNIEHEKAALDALGTIKGQLEYRLDAIKAALAQDSGALSGLSGIVGRGGLLKPMEGGVYEVDAAMVTDALENPIAHHAANLGCALAYKLSSEYEVPSFIVDAVCTDEYEPEARISGLPQVPRISFNHALSVRATARRAAAEIGKSLDDSRFVVVHLGGGTTVCSMLHGRLVDGNNSNDEGPFTPERTGSLPAGSVIEMCFSGEYAKPQIKELFLRRSGLYGYTGTNDVRQIRKRIEEGDTAAKEVISAMAYQTAKEIGAFAAVADGRIDAVVITGGIAHWDAFIEEIKEYVGFLGRFLVYPGENEMQALAEGATLALLGKVPVKKY